MSLHLCALFVRHIHAFFALGIKAEFRAFKWKLTLVISIAAYSQVSQNLAPAIFSEVNNTVMVDTSMIMEMEILGQ